MRTFVCGSIAVCLIGTGIGGYLAIRSWKTIPAASVVAEAQPDTPEPPVPIQALVKLTTPKIDILPEEFEPIVVEAPPQVVTKTVPVVDDDAEFDVEIGVQAPVTAQRACRPDEEPGREQKMPYAETNESEPSLPTRLWQGFCRLLLGKNPFAEHTVQTIEPPVAEPPVAEPPVKPEMLLPPIYNYHQHEQCCPYTGRCPLPYHPAPPVTTPERPE